MGFFVAMPLIASSGAYIWSRFFGAEENFPAGPIAHRLLILGQMLVTLWVFSTFMPELARIALAFMYGLLALGAAYFRLTKGSIPCGCMGPQSNHRLSWWLVFVDAGLAALALLSVQEHVEYAPLSGLSLYLIAFIFCLFITTGIPDALYAIQGYKRAADRYRSWISGYKELLP